MMQELCVNNIEKVKSFQIWGNINRVGLMTAIFQRQTWFAF